MQGLGARRLAGVVMVILFEGFVTYGSFLLASVFDISQVIVSVIIHVLGWSLIVVSFASETYVLLRKLREQEYLKIAANAELSKRSSAWFSIASLPEGYSLLMQGRAAVFTNEDVGVVHGVTGGTYSFTLLNKNKVRMATDRLVLLPGGYKRICCIASVEENSKGWHITTDPTYGKS